ncbi:putative primosomal protein N' [metagenome]|uniref:Putative primosomal protein N n=1 Tax=metagenome TaxID=256318 RepID=A0A2P2BYC1_9ZZZZ
MTDPGASQPEQQDLLPGLAPRPASRRPAPVPVTTAAVDPVARVLVDVALAHLDRPFDYAVPESMSEVAVPGVRVKVRFAGQEVQGYVVARAAVSEHTGRLTPIRRVVSGEPVLSPEITALTHVVAQRYAGTRSDVLRLAVPPRHATVERAAAWERAEPPQLDRATLTGAWEHHPPGPAFVEGLLRGDPVRAVWSAAPATDWPALLAAAAAASYAAGRGSLVLVPDGKDLDRVEAAVVDLVGAGHHVALRADSGPSRRYRDFLAVSRGARRIVLGTRSAAFAPVHDLGLLALWDDGDDLHSEPRAPYPHAREVLLLRAEAQSASVLLGGFARTVEAEYLVRTGWARELLPPRDLVRQRVTVSITGASDRDLARDPTARSARLPRQASELIRSALATGPVLVQTPRSGYAASLACERCRTPARCATCSGPLRLTGPSTPPACRWCGTEWLGWVCAECGHRGLRAPVVGDARTAEELGRSFPGVRVLTSSGASVLATVTDRSGIVVATPGAEPSAPDGYAAVVLLDTWLALGRTDLRAQEEAVRRWLNAAALVRPGGDVVAVGDPASPALQALVRWDPAGFARREMAERQSAHLPPASRLATVTGEPDALEQALAAFEAPAGAEVLGPVPSGDEGEVRAVIRVPRALGPDLSAALGDLQRTRSSRKLPAVRVQVDPPSLG